ncbi:MAG: cytochrome c3 family protein [Deltaproteobacteria bacterium]
MKRATIIAAALALWIGVYAAAETAAGGGAPAMLELGRLSDLYEPVRFNHAGHVSMAGGCADCHHQHGSVQVQTCPDCHRIDPKSFKKNANAGSLKPCRDCHAASAGPGDIGRPGLKAAYHQACFKCHRGDVGSVGKDPKGCTEMCHERKAQAKAEAKK